MKDAKEYFKHYKKSDECHQTADGFIFHNDYDARAHARSLSDKKIEKHTRYGEVEVWKEREPKKEEEKQVGRKAGKKSK